MSIIHNKDGVIVEYIGDGQYRTRSKCDGEDSPWLTIAFGVRAIANSCAVSREAFLAILVHDIDAHAPNASNDSDDEPFVALRRKAAKDALDKALHYHKSIGVG